MRKATKRLTSAVVALAMLVTTLFANVSVAYAQDRLMVNNLHSSLTVEGDNLMDLAPAPTAMNEKLLAIGTSFIYSNSSEFSLGGNEYGKIAKISVDKRGLLKLKLEAGAAITKSVTGELYTEAECVNRVTGVYLYLSENIIDSDTIEVLPGDYYLKVSSSAYGDTSFQNAIAGTIEFYDSSDMQIQPDQWYNVAESASDACYTFEVTGTKYVNIMSNKRIYYELLDENKMPIHDYFYSPDTLEVLGLYAITARLKAGTYYLKVKNITTDDYANLEYKLAFTMTGDYQLKNKQFMALFPAAMDEISYLKFKASKTGVVDIELAGNENYDTSATVQLCNANKKAISIEQSVIANSSYSNKASFGVKKGKTYYIKAKSIGGLAAIRYTMKGIKEKSGKSKKKAVMIKKGKKISGVLVAGENGADWYKVKLPKSKYLSMDVGGDTSGYIKMQIYHANGKKWSGENTITTGINSKRTVKSWSKVKGTFYLKVFKNDKNVSGSYYLKLK